MAASARNKITYATAIHVRNVGSLPETFLIFNIFNSPDEKENVKDAKTAKTKRIKTIRLYILYWFRDLSRCKVAQPQAKKLPHRKRHDANHARHRNLKDLKGAETKLITHQRTCLRSCGSDGKDTLSSSTLKLRTLSTEIKFISVHGHYMDKKVVKTTACQDLWILFAIPLVFAIGHRTYGMVGKNNSILAAT